MPLYDGSYLSQLIALYEALNAGVTSLLDHSHGIVSEAVAAAALDAYIYSGARVWFGYGFDPSESFPIPGRVANFRELADDKGLPDSLVKMGVAFDS